MALNRTDSCENCIYKDGWECQAPAWYHRLCNASVVTLTTRTYVPDKCPAWLEDVNKKLRKAD